MKNSMKFRTYNMLGGMLLAFLFSSVNTASADSTRCTYTRGSGSDSIQACKDAQGFEDWKQDSVNKYAKALVSHGGLGQVQSLSSTYWRGKIWMVYHENNGNTIKVASMNPNDTYAKVELVFSENTIGNQYFPGLSLNTNIIPSIAGTEGTNGTLHIVFGVNQSNGGTEFYHVKRDPNLRKTTNAWLGTYPQSVAGHYGSTHPSLHASGRNLYLASVYNSGGRGSYADNLYIYHYDGTRWVKAYRAMSKGKPIQTDPSSPAALIMGSGSDMVVVLKEKKSGKMRRYATTLRYSNLGVWRDVGPIGYNADYMDGRPAGTLIGGAFHVVTGIGSYESIVSHAVLKGSKAAVVDVVFTQNDLVSTKNPSIVSYYKNGQPVVKMLYAERNKDGFTSVLSVSHPGKIRFPR